MLLFIYLLACLQVHVVQKPSLEDIELEGTTLVDGKRCFQFDSLDSTAYVSQSSPGKGLVAILSVTVQSRSQQSQVAMKTKSGLQSLTPFSLPTKLKCVS